MRRLIQQRILPRLRLSSEGAIHDAAVLPPPSGKLVYTTDSFVVTPLFFPGGDIGKLAVYGTVNDLAVSGARPLWMSVAFIIEEGLPFSTLDAVLDSIAKAAASVGVGIVTGDTKVVPRGAADGIFVNTTGVGELLNPAPTGPSTLSVGDVLLVSGPIAKHGTAVLIAREDLGFTPAPESDCGPLIDAVETLRAADIPLRAMRDATRGGVAAVLHEWAESSGHSMVIDESTVPLTDDVRGALELMGLDPLHVANEGTMVVAVPGQYADVAVGALRQIRRHVQSAVIGAVVPRGIAPVAVRRGLGQEIPLDEPLGAPLPRIC